MQFHFSESICYLELITYNLPQMVPLLWILVLGINTLLGKRATLVHTKVGGVSREVRMRKEGSLGLLFKGLLSKKDVVQEEQLPFPVSPLLPFCFPVPYNNFSLITTASQVVCSE